MATLKDIINRRKLQASPFGLEAESVRATLQAIARDAVMSHIPNLINETEKKVVKLALKYLQEKVPHIKGDKGDTGQRGPQGNDGKPGKDGLDSSIPGPRGETGKSGKDGSPDTPDQVVEKVNSAKKKIKPERIDGLVEKMNDIAKRGGKKGGGGMGNVQHEHTAISSATTSVSTTYTIAGGGFALWCFYNGQMIARGTDYTVSGKTITLLFTPQDGTVFDIIYMR